MPLISQFTPVNVYWPLILIWGIVGIIYIGHFIKHLIFFVRNIINNRRKALIVPDWSGAYLRRIPSAELVNQWKCDLCPHTSLEDCALRGCIGLPREVYLARAVQLPGTSGQNPEDAPPSYADVSANPKAKVKALRKKRGTGRARPRSTNLSGESSHLLGGSTSSNESPIGQRRHTYNSTDDTLNSAPPPPYSYPSGSETN